MRDPLPLSGAAPKQLAVGPRSVWAALGASGAISAVYRDGQPARGVDPVRLRRLFERLDANHDTGAVLSACVQLATALPLLGEHARDSDAYATTLAGEGITALAATDAGVGSDLAALDTTFSADGGSIVVTGSKRWITNATAADWFLVLGRRREGPHFTNFSWALVPADAHGVTVEPADTTLFSGAAVGHLHFDVVTLPADAVLGGAGRGLPLFARHIAVERLAGGLWAAVICRRVLTDTQAWLAARGDLWQKPTIRDAFARALVQARQLDALVDAVAPAVSAHHDTALAALVKAAAGLAVDQVVSACAHLQGAQGFTSDGLQRLRAEAAIFGIAGGTTEIVLAGVADHAERLLANPRVETATAL
ncbi:acyl-CoA dehydrogenase family protein [Burkholderia gladioli]|uniref:acyl-CoA dehydrogenase family protein n=1 Tax=Burkholderia gladioli TaxID=28095 RepID=UPI001ABB6887|nr:acyl-CoA dehydrogenase [Burkholderia gladioli]